MTTTPKPAPRDERIPLCCDKCDGTGRIQDRLDCVCGWSGPTGATRPSRTCPACGRNTGKALDPHSASREDPRIAEAVDIVNMALRLYWASGEDGGDLIRRHLAGALRRVLDALTSPPPAREENEIQDGEPLPACPQCGAPVRDSNDTYCSPACWTAASRAPGEPTHDTSTTLFGYPMEKVGEQEWLYEAARLRVSFDLDDDTDDAGKLSGWARISIDERQVLAWRLRTDEGPTQEIEAKIRLLYAAFASLVERPGNVSSVDAKEPTPDRLLDELAKRVMYAKEKRDDLAERVWFLVEAFELFIRRERAKGDG